MRARLLWKAVILLFLLPLLLLLSSCQLLGGSTEVTFFNNTSFALGAIQFGPLIVGGGLAPGAQTGSYPIPPGQNVLTAESGSAWTTAVLLSIAAGHGYLITFNPAATFSQVTVSLVATN